MGKKGSKLSTAKGSTASMGSTTSMRIHNHKTELTLSTVKSELGRAARANLFPNGVTRIKVRSKKSVTNQNANSSLMLSAMRGKVRMSATQSFESKHRRGGAMGLLQEYNVKLSSKPAEHPKASMSMATLDCKECIRVPRDTSEGAMVSVGTPGRHR